MAAGRPAPPDRDFPDPAGDNKASILTFAYTKEASTKEASEESAIYGMPDKICAKIDKLRDLGVECLLLTGGGSRESLRRFARDIMPIYTSWTVRAVMA